MTEETNLAPNLYALLIGVDCYMPNKLPNGDRYSNLGGCVRDINHVEAFLKDIRKVPETQILKLTASVNPENPNLEQPVEPREKLPTRKNIVDSFRKLAEMAPPLSQVYIQYSGHGGRAKTHYRDIKGDDGIDEGLVPTDIGTSEGQYLRDLELAKLLKELVDKELVVTLVLDCCHSGGATRGDVQIRGMDVVDDKPLQSTFEPVAELDVLVANWKALNGTETRGLKAVGLPEAKDYVVLAACRQNEVAYEYAFNRETKERNGALTYWLLDTLRQQNPGQTHKDLFERIQAKIHSQFPSQTPILIGEVNREIFGSNLAETVYAVPVLKVEQNAQTGVMQAMLAVGQVNGLNLGAEFAIYPLSTTDFTKKENRVAIARIIQRGATESLCKLEPIEGKEFKVEDGDQAVLISPSIELVRQVSLVYLEEAAPPEQTQPALPFNKLLPEIYKQQANALEAIKIALAGNGWVKLAEEKVADDEGEGVAYQVALNNNGEYEICDRTGHPFENITAVKLSSTDAAVTVVKRLVHLAKYHVTEELDNHDKTSPLADKLVLSWLGTSDDYQPGDKIPPKSQLQQFTDPSNPTVKIGEYIFLSIHNNSSQDLNIAVLDLASDWSIEQIYPGKGLNLETIEAGRKEVVPIPAGSAGKDTVKVFATVGSANFRWLELPSLDEELKPKGLSRSGNPLDTLLAAIDEKQPPTRKLSVAASPSREWTTKQIRLIVTT